MGLARDDAATLATAMASLHNSVTYLRAISLMAQQQQVVAVQTVCSDQGVVLLEKGAVIGADLLDVLAAHRLLMPLDAQLSASEPMGIAALQVEATQLLASHPLGRLLAAEMGGEQERLKQALRDMVWPAQASFKMAVIRGQLPTLLEHSLLMMLAAVFLAVRAGWDDRQCARVAEAALLHDVGMLYMPTSWMDAGYKLTVQERSQLAAHSITGSMVVHAMQAYPHGVEDAVLEHHEHMDGSGYPRQLRGEDISPMGRILMVAEVVSGFYGKYTTMAGERLSLMLRLHRRRFPQDLVAPVLAMLQRDAATRAHTMAPEREGVLKDSQTLATVFQYWASCKRVLPERWQAQPGGRAVLFVDACLRELETTLAETGAHARQQVDWLAIFDQEPQSMLELGLINREVLWQMERCIYTCMRRWPQVPPGSASLVERALWT